MTQLSGDFRHPALLLIDLQNAFFETEELAAKRDQVVANCNRLIAAAREAGAPVINARTVHKRDGSTWTLKMLEDEQGYLFEGTEQAENLSELDLDGAISIIKRRDSVFWNTELLTQLLQHRVTSLIMAGVSSHTCVAATASDAFAANLAVVVATDAVASEDPDFEDVTLKLLREQHRQRLAETSSIVRLLQVSHSHHNESTDPNPLENAPTNTGRERKD